jgi:hypothetical protein
MSILQRLKSWWMGSQQNHTYTYTLGEPVQLIQTERADQETEPNFGDVSAVRPPRQEFEYEVYRRCWLGLSPREQQVTAFTCSDFRSLTLRPVGREAPRRYSPTAGLLHPRPPSGIFIFPIIHLPVLARRGSDEKKKSANRLAGSTPRSGTI